MMRSSSEEQIMEDSSAGRLALVGCREQGTQLVVVEQIIT